MTIFAVAGTVLKLHNLKLPIFRLIRFFFYSNDYLSEAFAWPDSLPGTLFYHLLIN